MFPHGKMLRLRVLTVCTVEGAAIARYREYEIIMIGHLSIDCDHPHAVAALTPESGLLPKSLNDHALVDQWCHLVESELFDNTVRTWLLCQGKFGPYSEEVRQSFSNIRLPSHYYTL